MVFLTKFINNQLIHDVLRLYTTDEAFNFRIALLHLICYRLSYMRKKELCYKLRSLCKDVST